MYLQSFFQQLKRGCIELKKKGTDRLTDIQIKNTFLNASEFVDTKHIHVYMENRHTIFLYQQILKHHI